jgi:FeS assembly protein IscX
LPKSANYTKNKYNTPNILICFYKIMKWTDSLDIAIALDEKHPDFDPLTVNFVDLTKMVVELDEFDDDAGKTGEKILEAIQMHWIEEK